MAFATLRLLMMNHSNITLKHFELKKEYWLRVFTKLKGITRDSAVMDDITSFNYIQTLSKRA